MKTRGTIEASSDSDNDEQFSDWDAASDIWWQIASNHESVNNSPVKAGWSSELPHEPPTPMSSNLAETLQARLDLKPGGACKSPSLRNELNTQQDSHYYSDIHVNSPPQMRSHSVTSGQHISRQFGQSAPSIEKQTRDADEPSSSQVTSVPNSNQTAVQEVRSETVTISTPTKSSRRLASLNEVYKAGKKSSCNSLSRTGRGGSSRIDRTPGPIRDSVTSSSRTISKSDSDADMDELEVEQLVGTDTESSVPPTRQNSLLSPASSRSTSMTSIETDFSLASSSGRRKRSSQDHEDQSESAPITPPKMRRTTDGPQTPMGPMSSLVMPRALTSPLPKTKEQYSVLPVDEPSIFRASPAKSNIGDSVVPQQSLSIAVAAWKSPPQSIVFTSSSTIPVSTPMPIKTAPSPKTLSDNTAPVFAFLDAIVQADKYFCIAHNRHVQEAMDIRQLSWGVQFEIARGVSQGIWQWADVTPIKLDHLKGTNAEAASRVRGVILDLLPPSSRLISKEHWRELDREQKAILENKGRGLGLMGDWEGKSKWYGGQIQQVARIAPVDKGSDNSCGFQLALEPLEQRKSNRFARILGSRRMLQVRVPKDLAHGESSERLRRFMAQKFVLCGRVFVPFHAKEGKVYLMETDEDYERLGDMREGDQYRMSLAAFVSWHNPLDLNHKQPISKWATRWALGLSTSVPILQFESENIKYIDDIYAPLDPGQMKPPPEKTMTDGCGFINGAALCRIAELMGFPHRPTAVQGRIGGTKGMWMLHPNDQAPNEPSRIWNRLSQKKINHPPIRFPLTPCGRALLVFDLLSISRVGNRSRLSMLSINNLCHNGIPDDVFKSLMRQDLEDEVRPLTQWTESMLPVAKAISDAGGITGARLQRFAGGTSRAHGFTRDFHRDEDVGVAGSGVAALNSPVSAGRDSSSGAPISVHEVAYEMLAAGFHPIKMPVLADKIHQILKLVIKAYVNNFKIAVSESVEAFILPDPYGVLEEGEIFFRSSQHLMDLDTMGLFNTVEGDVIVGRNPVRLPSDLQKVRAVDCAKLRNFCDVIVFSTKGKCSLASLLAGGDYDGDTVFLIWQKALVANFCNSQFCPPPPDFIQKHFKQQAESILSFGSRVALLPPTDLQAEFLAVLLSGLRDARVGQYSVLHDNAVFVNGYDHSETVRLARMVGYCLDSDKLGLDLRKEVFRHDTSMFKGGRVASMFPEEASGMMNLTLLQERLPGLGPFILDTLLRFGAQLANQHLVNFDRLLETVDQRKDDDLLQPYKVATAIASQTSAAKYDGYSLELEAIKSHVEAVFGLWTVAASSGSQDASPYKSPTKKRDPAKTKSDPWREVSRAYAKGPTNSRMSIIPNIDAVKASYAYTFHTPKFAFSVAFKDLCSIKARASQDLPITREFAEAMSIVPSFLRALGQCESDCG